MRNRFCFEGNSIIEKFGDSRLNCAELEDTRQRGQFRFLPRTASVILGLSESTSMSTLKREQHERYARSQPPARHVHCRKNVLIMSQTI